MDVEAVVLVHALIHAKEQIVVALVVQTVLLLVLDHAKILVPVHAMKNA